MYKPLKKFALLLCITGVFLYLAPSTFASNEFSTSYNVYYTVTSSQQTHTQFSVALTNNTSDYYASSYKIQVGFENVSHITASDPNGAITPELTKTNTGYLVNLAFNKRVVGLHNTLNFTLSFDTTDIAHKIGNIWEINIPGITNQNDFSDFIVHVNVPKDFENPVYIKPNQGTNSLVFTKEQLGKSGISIAFGNKQTYAFHLTYHLRNKNIFPIKTEIALPPTTNYQTIAIDSMSPRPENVFADKDGNWLAQYELLPSQKFDALVSGKASLSLTPNISDTPRQQLTDYLREEPYWQVQSAQIQKLAEKLKTPEAIYTYVVSTLHYDFARISSNEDRLGAVTVLNHPDQAVCLEYTDLFIALARAAGIPAREVDGFAYTENTKERPLSRVKDILHAWPEYYDSASNRWVMVDPTWGSTTGGVDYFHTLDFDHFAFVIKGENSDYPIPAGGYKYPGNENNQDIQVDFSNKPVSTIINYQITPNIAQTYLSGFPVKASVRVTNISGPLSPEEPFIISSSNFKPSTQTLTVPALLPFAHADIPVSFNRTSLLTNSSYRFRILVAGKVITQQTTVTPFLFGEKQTIGGLIFGILAIILLIIAIKTRRLYVLGQGR